MRRVGSVKFWAWTASVLVHLVILAVFSLVNFSQSPAQAAQRPTPLAKVTHIKKMLEVTANIPKPRIKRSSSSSFTKPDKSFFAGPIFDRAKPKTDGLANFATESSAEPLVTGSAILPSGIEFFGSWTNQRKVCYLVDCSGSMQGIFGRVQKQLKDSVIALQADQYFCIIFFGSNRLFEFGDGRLQRASTLVKSKACDFIDSTRPGGQTNAIAALRKAFEVRDAGGSGPSVIYFLTDGFELNADGSKELLKQIAGLRSRFAPQVKINTIGFWPQGDDRVMLKSIASHSGGEFVAITDDIR